MLNNFQPEPAVTAILALLALAVAVSGYTNPYVAGIFLLIVAILVGLTVRAWLRARAIENKRIEFVETALRNLPPESIALLKLMMVIGRPNQTQDTAWTASERAGLVERDFVGPKGIKEELRMALERKLKDL